MGKCNRLSHSAINTYMSCPKKWEYHYKYKLRHKYNSSALLFGSALDAALTTMLIQHGQGKMDWLGQEYLSVFNNNWVKGKINDKFVDLMDNELMVYAASDFDYKILQPKDWLLALSKREQAYPNAGIYDTPDAEGLLELYKNIGKRKEVNGFDNLHSDERRFYNFMNWMSLYRKGELMLTAYIKEVIPRIKKVLAVQKEINIQGEAGDSIIGYIDLIAEWEDGSIVIFDNKTSARAYEEDAVKNSTQLTLYTHAVENEYKTRKAGFIVLRKAINKDVGKKCGKCGFNGDGSRAKTCNNEIGGKRCPGEWIETINPKAEIQVLINEIPAQLEKIVMENFADINQMIKTDVFPRNLNSCLKPFPCQFYKLCHANDDSDLVSLKTPDEKAEESDNT